MFVISHKGDILQDKFDKLVDGMKETVEGFFGLGIIQSLAYKLGIHRDTIYDWAEKHPKFSDTLRLWQMKKAHILIKNNLKIAAKSSPLAIFLNKTCAGMIEANEIRHTDKDGENLFITVVDDDKLIEENEKKARKKKREMKDRAIGKRNKAKET